jgi:hypothetical protein
LLIRKYHGETAVMSALQAAIEGGALPAQRMEPGARVASAA